VTTEGAPDRLVFPVAGTSVVTKENLMELVLWILAVILVIAGVFALFRRQVLWGVVLIVVGLLVGPGGVSIFT
jgi:hypothetical protein